MTEDGLLRAHGVDPETMRPPQIPAALESAPAPTDRPGPSAPGPGDGARGVEEITQRERRAFLRIALMPLEADESPERGIYRKRARIVAMRLPYRFRVETDRGWMDGAAGDWLVTNHPDDDPGSDLWSISDARMRATYQPVEP